MKRLALLALLAGCGSSSPPAVDAGPPDGAVTPAADAVVRDNGPPMAPDGPPDGPTVMVGWDLVFVNTDARITCTQAGTPSVVLRTTPQGGGASTEVSVPCEARSLSIPTPDPGRYQVQIELRDTGNRLVSSNSGSFNFVLGGSTDLGVVVFEVQSFVMTWSLQRGGHDITCADAGAATVELSARLAADPPVIYSFPCAPGAGSTPAILLGNYELRPRLLGPGGMELSALMSRVVPVSDEQRAILPPIVFSL